MSKNGFTMIIKIMLFILLIGLSACNVFEGTHTVGSSNNPDSLLIDADSEFGKNNYASAASLYLQVLALEPTNSRAMKGYAAVILFRDLYISDVPIILTNIYSIENVATSNEFNTNLNGIGTMTAAQYHTNVMAVMSNACYYRSPIHGIDQVSGIMTTNSSGLPVAANSDGVITPTDRTSLLNYLLTKAVHMAMYVQQEFKVYGNLVSGIDVNSYTNSFTAVDQDTFTNSHIQLTNDIMALSNAYIDVTNIILGTSGNTSWWNWLAVADSYLSILGNDLTNGDIIQSSYDNAEQIINGLKTAVTALAVSITNTSSGINAGFDAMATFRSDAETAAAGFGWYPY